TEQAQRDYEGVDVENDAHIFYNEDGIHLEPIFSTPNQYGKFLGLIPWRKSGTFTLQPKPDTREDPIWLVLYEVHDLNTNPWFQTLDDVKAYFKSRGVPVEQPD